MFFVPLLYCQCSLRPGSVNLRMERLINNASSVILADITIDALKHLDSLEV